MKLTYFVFTTLSIFFFKTVKCSNASLLKDLQDFLVRIKVVDKYPEDAYLKTDELLTKYGYPVESHYVTTEDGYILQMIRIPHGKDKKTASKNQAVYVQHGAYSSSADWLLKGPEKALAYALADAGYDVWLGNSRGNLYSLNHTTLEPTPNNKQYWDFSWHELGIYDLPASIDYILEETEQDDLIYIGHSQGTTILFVLLSELPEYNSKIKIGLTMSPLGFVSHMGPPERLLIGPLTVLLKLLRTKSLFSYHQENISILVENICNLKFLGPRLCMEALFLVEGYDRRNADFDVLKLFYPHFFAGGSTKQLYHYSQEIYSGQFRQYDYGIKNLQKYSSKSPPDYNLTNITTKIYMLYSGHDFFSGVEDVEKLCSIIQDCTKILIEDGKYNHFDYLIGKNADKLVYQKIFNILEKKT